MHRFLQNHDAKAHEDSRLIGDAWVAWIVPSPFTTTKCAF